MNFENVALPLGARLVNLITVLTIEVFGSLQYGKIELGDRVGRDVRMPLGEVVHKHPAPLEAQHAGGAFVDKEVQVS